MFVEKLRIIVKDAICGEGEVDYRVMNGHMIMVIYNMLD